MQVFRVDDMTCGHCVASITEAVRAVDAGAKVGVDLAQRLVRIEPTEADASELAGAITEAGYSPVLVENPFLSEKAAGGRTGCCGCSG
ncbi:MULTISPECIES: heavy-metal-associated domain-containing protein [Roseateles]|uniref:Copper chaperone n=1 Tax=Pelomonas aquatica TaxID=431058 RepID=A0ABU1Z259_9BURK|nr:MULTISPECIES: heavy-metal-associated domain-containing protein [Roseateles]KQY81002.1 heavy metal transporter [Pelomonas sp. Root1444]MDR7294707.1 copper chaperone [Pelomonas aquatica]